MAIIMLIAADQINEPYQYLNDIVGTFADDHPFTDTEKKRFSFLTVKGSRVDVQAKLDKSKPTIATAFHHKKAGKWSFIYTTPEDVDQEKIVWLKDKRWYDYKNQFKFPLTIDSCSPEEKQMLATTDVNHFSIDATIEKTVKSIESVVANNVEVTDLKNQVP